MKQMRQSSVHRVMVELLICGAKLSIKRSNTGTWRLGIEHRKGNRVLNSYRYYPEFKYALSDAVRCTKYASRFEKVTRNDDGSGHITIREKNES